MRRLMVCAAAAAVGLAGCTGTCPVKAAKAAPALKTARLGLDLSGRYKSPDGMTVKDGAVWLSINNLASGQPSCIAKITKDDRIEKIIDLPVHPETGVCSSLGLVFAADGNLYVSDNQNLAGKGMGKSRVLRVVFEKGKAVRAEVVAVGLHAANGIAARGDSVFVNETTFGEGDPMDSGTYRFKLAELKAGAPVKVDGTPKDKHVIFTLKTRGPVKVGANGLCFDGDGNLCVANFGDQEIWKVSFDKAGNVKKSALFTKVTCAQSIDGMQYDGKGSLWFADFLGNAVVRVCAKSGKAVVVAKNPPCDGLKGELDSPSECIRLGDKVYVSNIDLTFGPHQADDKQTISIIDL
ncbi:MAG: SMP-30/gluconolactonase/LRE family protein [bacterium]